MPSPCQGYLAPEKFQMKNANERHLVDTHAHLDMLAKTDTELSSILEKARAEGVVAIISVGIDLESSRKAVSFAESYENVYVSVGVHPNDATIFSEDVFDALESLVENRNVKAWGEIGLDFYRDYTPRKLQYEAFEAQLDAASKRGLPVIIHARDALKECIEIIEGFSNKRDLHGVFHCFSGDVEEARRVLDLDFFISFTGVITFPNAKMVREVAAYVPIQKILIETDAPFLSPVPYRGKPNEPARVKYVAEAIAKIKDMDFSEVASCTTSNARALFDLSVQ